MKHSTPGLPIHHQLPESTQTHVHCVGDAIQPSHPLLSPSPPALNLSQHQGLFKWVSSPHQVAETVSLLLAKSWGFPGGSVVKNMPAKVGDSGLISESERSPGEGNGNPLQYSSWRTSWTEAPGGPQSMRSQRARHGWVTKQQQQIRKSGRKSSIQALFQYSCFLFVF